QERDAEVRTRVFEHHVAVAVHPGHRTVGSGAPRAPVVDGTVLVGARLARGPAGRLPLGGPFLLDDPDRLVGAEPGDPQVGQPVRGPGRNPAGPRVTVRVA